MVSAEREGGEGLSARLTDCGPASVTFEMPVELTFRRLHDGEEYVNYFWKFRPAHGEGTTGWASGQVH